MMLSSVPVPDCKGWYGLLKEVSELPLKAAPTASDKVTKASYCKHFIVPGFLGQMCPSVLRFRGVCVKYSVRVSILAVR